MLLYKTIVGYGGYQVIGAQVDREQEGEKQIEVAGVEEASEGGEPQESPRRGQGGQQQQRTARKLVIAGIAKRVRTSYSYIPFTKKRNSIIL